ncbi:MAG: DUF2911 domain-containing protein [Bacteroidia bacterium]
MKHKNLLHKAAFMAVFMLISATSWAQIKMPAPSPGSKVTQAVGLSDVTISYSRPSAKGRKVFGDVVPFDQKWRTGANQSTKITFAEDVKVEGKDVKAGDYALVTIPGKTEWTIILHKNINMGGNLGKDYKADEEVVNVKVKPINLANKVETFTINFADLTMNSANVELSWENTAVKFNITTDVDSRVMKDINDKMAGVSASTYYQSARYYYDTNKDIKKAVEYINKAVEMDPKFYIVYLQAQILAKSGDTKKAIEAANRSIKLAKEADNADYVAMNEKLIAELSKKK